MPELPEVETVRRVLKTEIISKTINSVEIRYDKIIDGDVNDFIANVTGKSFKDIKRLGKFLIFELNEGFIVSHLRMEGKYFYLPENSLDNKHIHVIFHLSNGYALMYQDVRKFGRMIYKNKDELYTTKPLNEVGIDIILEKEIDINEVYGKIITKHKEIKTVLLDQSILAGLGNIYVDEVLYAAHVNPTRYADTITLDEVKSIVFESKRILEGAILHKGTTIRSYTSSLGVEGEYQNFLCVHTKDVCPCCKNKLDRLKINGRTSYFCSNCQRWY